MTRTSTHFFSDRFIRGFTAGVLASVVASVLNYFLVRVVGFGNLLFVDVSGYLVYGRQPGGFGEYAFAQVVDFGFSGMMGVLFSYIVNYIRPSYLLIKSTIFGLIIWFFIYAIGLLFRIPLLTRISLATAIEDYITAGTFGIILGWVYLRLPVNGRGDTEI